VYRIEGTLIYTLPTYINRYCRGFWSWSLYIQIPCWLYNQHRQSTGYYCMCCFPVSTGWDTKSRFRFHQRLIRPSQWCRCVLLL